MEGRRVAVFACPYAGHTAPLLPLVAGLADRGLTPYVFTSRGFAEAFERVGARFVDMFGRYPLEDADDESLPVVSRHVTFAAHYAADLLRDLRELRPSLVVYETFAVVGRVLATAMGLPYVNVSAGHNLAPAAFLERLRVDPRVAISPRCLRAVEELRDHWGIADASPFSYVTGISPFLNLLCEPSVWLTEDERRVFEPVAYLGCLPPVAELEARRADVRPSYFGDARRKVYASFGTVPWWYWSADVVAGLEAVTQAVRTLPETHGVIGLGGADFPPERVAAWRRQGMTVLPYVDSWLALRDADVFITSQGLCSTHEAIYSRVPMVSYPFFWDQPELAGRCAAFGVAVPLVEAPRAPVKAEDVVAALRMVDEQRQQMLDALDHARNWELDVLAGRNGVMDLVTELIGQAA